MKRMIEGKFNCEWRAPRNQGVIKNGGAAYHDAAYKIGKILG